MPIFARLNPGDITIHNPFTKDRLRLHSFRHKGYWYHGRRREAASMALFAELIIPGDSVAEVGGHIGYITQYFTKLVGPQGQVTVFEPGPNNLPYLRRNTRDMPNVEVVEMGVGSEPGHADFFVEQITGQNNSFVEDFEGLTANAAAAGLEPGVERIRVAMTSLDAHFDVAPDFIKIDVEGFELSVLKGATRVMRTAKPLFMVEVQADQALISELSERYGYVVLREDLSPVDWSNFRGNSFWFHRERHAEFLSSRAVADK